MFIRILYKLIKRLNLQQQQHREKIHKTLLKTHKNTPHKQTCAASATKKTTRKREAFKEREKYFNEWSKSKKKNYNLLFRVTH